MDVQSRPAIDFTLKVGQSTQVVEVLAPTPVLQTETADVGGVVQGAQINDLPLNGRRYSDLALLEAGIQRNQVNQNNTAPDRFSSNGNLETQNYFSLDGVDNNSGSTNLQESSVQVIQPPPDACRVPDSDANLLRGIRHGGRRGDKRQHQVRQQFFPRRCLGVPPQ